jgi:hypothetical protein
MHRVLDLYDLRLPAPGWSAPMSSGRLEIDAIADPERLLRLDLAVLDD